MPAEFFVRQVTVAGFPNRHRLDNFLAYFDTKLTSGAIEAVNGIIQLAIRMARGSQNSSTSEPRPTIELVSSI